MRAAAICLVALGGAACSSAPTRAPVTYAHSAPHRTAPSNSAPLRLASAIPDASVQPFDGLTAPRILDGTTPSECVPYARAASGIPIYGDAVTWWDQAAGRFARSGSPAPGSVMVMRGYSDDTRGHVAVVVEMISPRLMRVDHANWLGHGEISVSVPVMDISPDNSWSEVRVWHVPGGYWGGRAYRTQGFIHPYGGAPG